MAITVPQLDQQLRSGKRAAVYLLLGGEGYLRYSAIERIVRAATPEGEALVPTRFDAKAAPVHVVLDAAQSSGLFSAQQAIVVGDIAEWEGDETAAMGRYIAAPNPATTLLLWAEKLDQRTKFARELLAAVTVVECKALYANQVPEWVRIECQRQGREISREAAHLLAEAVGADLSTVQQAITKAVLYTEGKRLINLEDVEAVVLETSQRTIFEFLHAVGRRDRLTSLRHLDRLLAHGEPAVRVCTMLAWHWRILLRAQEWLENGGQGEPAGVLKVSPYFAKEYVAQAKGFASAALQRGIGVLAATDRSLKRSRLPARAILTKTVMDMLTESGG